MTMAKIKLKKPQEIVDNINKIKKGDLVFVRVPKAANKFTKKCFLIGIALADIEERKITTTFHRNRIKTYILYLLVGNDFLAILYQGKINKTLKIEDRKLEINFRFLLDYNTFMKQFKTTFDLKGF